MNALQMAQGCVISVALLSLVMCFVDSKPAGNIETLTGPISGHEEAFALNFMTSYGYLEQPDPRLGSLRTQEDLVRAIKGVQRFAGIKVTGNLNTETLQLMKKPRCGIPDFGPADNMRRRKRYAIQGSKWKRTNLTYVILNKPTSEHISENEIDRVVRKAFDMWSEVSPLTFEKINGQDADIRISFQNGRHNDGYPFDGPGGTLAHGFYPLENIGFAGDVHYDDDEEWVLDPKRGTDFFWTTLHEIGHAIGLDHTSYKNAIMYPYYRGSEIGTDLKLDNDDILGIQYIYGKPNPVRPTKPTVKKPDAGPSACRTPIDAVFHDKEGNTYFFKEKHFWKLDKNNKFSETLKIKDYWPELGRRVQAAYTRRDGKTVFFKGRRFWVYEGTKYIEGRKLITEYGLPVEMKRLDAVFVWGGNGKTYFFKGHRYWRYNERAGSIDPGYPRNISETWGDVPQPIGAAMTWKDDITYFFKDLEFYKFYQYDFKKQKQYPPGESVGTYFMGCSDVEAANRPWQVGNAPERTTVLTPLLILLSFSVSFAVF